MDKNDMRVAIAEERGFSNYLRLGRFMVGFPPLRIIPDYPNDPMAMKELVKELGEYPTIAEKFQNVLGAVIGLHTVEAEAYAKILHKFITASPEHLAEAYLKTVGKWVE